MESYALDAIDWYEKAKEYKALKSEVTKFQKAALSADAEVRPGVELGTDYRIESKKVTGFALSLNDELLHASIFAQANGRNTGIADSRIERFSRRRPNRGI